MTVVDLIATDDLQRAETWRDIPGYEGHYQVSDLGNVKSLARTRIRSNGRPLTTRERIRKAVVGSDGYLQVQLFRDGTEWTVGVHQLVMLAFHGPTPDGMEIFLRNGRSDIRLDSLYFGVRLGTEGKVCRHLKCGLLHHARGLCRKRL